MAYLFQMDIREAIRSVLQESEDQVFYHGSTDKGFHGKKGIHVGTYLAAKQALEARIGVPAEGEWDGTREYAKTLLAGKNNMRAREKSGIYCQSGFNCGDDVPEEDYYPTQRKKRATYSDGSPIPMNCHPIIFPVKIVGPMTNNIWTPLKDFQANGIMGKFLKMGKARRGYYYRNEGEDAGSISAVVPDGSFLRAM